jgi:hypothetical protein
VKAAVEVCLNEVYRSDPSISPVVKFNWGIIMNRGAREVVGSQFVPITHLRVGLRVSLSES